MALPAERPKLTGRAFYESLGSPKHILAPMVDQSEFAWRLLSRSFLPPCQQASLLAYTPMLHARLYKESQSYRDHHFQPCRTSLSKSDTDSDAYLDGHPTHDRPLIVQFCANDPDDLLQAALRVAPHCDAVDLNLGCPQGIARKGHYGSFLQESPNLIHSLISTLAKNLEIPVTAKMRILDTKEDTLRYAKLLLDAGASWIAVHGRRREQKGHETGLADWKVIRYLRENLSKETVIFANGNILGYEDLDQCLQKTGADGVMSAEGNLCDPGIFAGEEGRREGVKRGEYWVGKDGRGGWRMDAVLRRYLDILYKFVLEKEPPSRNPIFQPDETRNSIQPDSSTTEPILPVPELSPIKTDTSLLPSTNHQDNQHDAQPPAKKRKQNHQTTRTTSPNLLAVQAHLFHLLRPLVSKHTNIRDKLARARPGDMEKYEEILADVQHVTREGMLELENDQGRPGVMDGIGVGEGDSDVEKEEEEEDEGESSVKAVERCRRPWWVCQAYVRPLPKEALKKGSLKLGKKALKKLEAEAGNGGRNKTDTEHKSVKEKREMVEPVREETDERDGVPRQEMAQEAMHLGTRASTPIGLAPIGGAAEVSSSTAEVAARAAESGSTFGIDNGTAGITSTGDFGGGRGVWWGLLG
ncbi:MAG: hypothetical protein Q9205_003977 [Flavoplaca limonia]